MVNNSELISRDTYKTFAASSAATTVVNQPIRLIIRGCSIESRHTNSKSQGEDVFDRLAYKVISEECPILRDSAHSVLLITGAGGYCKQTYRVFSCLSRRQSHVTPRRCRTYSRTKSRHLGIVSDPIVCSTIRRRSAPVL